MSIYLIAQKLKIDSAIIIDAKPSEIALPGTLLD